MPKQLRFFRNATIQDRLLTKAAETGLSVYGLLPSDGAPSPGIIMVALGFTEPTTHSPWVFGDYIEYSFSSSGYDARLWLDPHYRDGEPKPKALRDAFSHLVRFIKSHAVFENNQGLWVPREFEREFLEKTEAKETELRLLVERNRLFAVNVLGAKLEPRDGDDHLE